MLLWALEVSPSNLQMEITGVRIKDGKSQPEVTGKGKAVWKIYFQTQSETQVVTE